MTCIVGFIDNDKTVYIGGDSAGSAGHYMTKRKDPKVFVRHPFIFGFTTSFRMGQILMCGDLKIRQQKKDEVDYEYMVNAFIPSIIKLFRENNWERKSKDGEVEGGTFLVGYKDKLYSIENDFQVAENLNNYDCVGCGADIAKGAMFAMSKDDTINAETRIKTALEAASEFSSWCASPFNIVKMVNDIKK